MSADFFQWKIYAKRVLYLLISVFSLFVFSYAIVVANAQALTIGKTFYFLVSSSTHVEASTHTAQWQGGAGYLLTSGKREYVVYAVYFSENAGNAVQTVLVGGGENVRLLERRAETLYLKTRREKSRANFYGNAFRSLYGIMQVLYGEIARLEEGATQTSSKQIVKSLSRQIDHLSRQYTSYSAYAKLCRQAGTRLSKISEDAVYAKDLRYELCFLADGYLNLASAFSL